MQSLCLMVFILSGRSAEKKDVKRAVFAWEGVEASDKEILDEYKIDTIFMDINN